MKIELSSIPKGEVFSVAGVEFINLSPHGSDTISAVTRDIIFSSEFGKDNNLLNSTVLEKLSNEFLPKIVKAVGFENVRNIKTDLTDFDFTKGYDPITSKISLLTLDAYLLNADIINMYEVEEEWWLATSQFSPVNKNTLYDGNTLLLCVSPKDGCKYDVHCTSIKGVRPRINFSSSTLVDCPSDDVLLIMAKHSIDSFLNIEYADLDGADFSNLSEISLAYTTTDDEQHEIEAFVNLVDFNIETRIDGQAVRTEQYESLGDIVVNGLPGLSFDDLVYVSEGEIAPFYANAK